MDWSSRSARETIFFYSGTLQMIAIVNFKHVLSTQRQQEGQRPQTGNQYPVPFVCTKATCIVITCRPCQIRPAHIEWKTGDKGQEHGEVELFVSWHFMADRPAHQQIGSSQAKSRNMVKLNLLVRLVFLVRNILQTSLEGTVKWWHTGNKLTGCPSTNFCRSA